MLLKNSSEVFRPLDNGVHIRYNTRMKAKDIRPTTGIRIKPDVLHRARVAAVTQKKTLGQWLEEAIEEKIEREEANREKEGT